MDMFSEYSQLMHAVEELRTHNEYQKGVELLIGHESIFIQRKYELLFNQLINLMLDENHESALNVHERIVDEGMCTVIDWGLFDPLRDDSRFKAVVEKSHLIRQSLQANASQKLEVYLPENYDSRKQYPLFVALHGDTNDLAAFQCKWPADYTTRQGYITLYIQSSQVICTNGYGWVPDFAITNAQIAEAVAHVKQSHSIDDDNVILGGFSGGAIAAIEVALSKSVHVRGVIGLCPSIKPPALTQAAIEQCKQDNTKFVIFAGEKDGADCVELEIAEQLKQAKVACTSHVNLGIGHAYPVDFEGQLHDAINWVNLR
ncbi:hypothetical protein PSECIP111951_01765 [Pseudoalteromonas holothuriae]|uniref:Phospholipase/carboxylesterase/thioesterase domain-containing protein n=1 Tax=Pseudoalteromonas holothuriae TaxID=2963714 RepID=A0A9W4QXV6_9GAMM|nr:MULTISPECIES: hypothetical protein [unclassified Pseudoalteromonas]CAH9057918.1 hypothetical protein PSECIP111951_01765 [Pseudoalteromonas sp. CIP111951]CAH9058768.1 hypothetical protein PSECIP111854_02269 [Pseudoalteromonas sp. CIP111854]